MFNCLFSHFTYNLFKQYCFFTRYSLCFVVQRFFSTFSIVAWRSTSTTAEHNIETEENLEDNENIEDIEDMDTSNLKKSECVDLEKVSETCGKEAGLTIKLEDISPQDPSMNLNENSVREDHIIGEYLILHSRGNFFLFYLLFRTTSVRN